MTQSLGQPCEFYARGQAMKAPAGGNAKAGAQTPLMGAAKAGAAEVVDILLAHGADASLVGGPRHDSDPQKLFLGAKKFDIYFCKSLWKIRQGSAGRRVNGVFDPPSPPPLVGIF